MEKYTEDKIVNDVRVCMDEIAPNDSEMAGTEQDDAELDVIIKSKIHDAIQSIYRAADITMLDISETKQATDGKIAIDGKFIRLIYAKGENWSRYLCHDDIIAFGSSEYSMLSDQYTSGTNERPKVAMGFSGGEKVLEFYPGAGKIDAGILNLPILKEGGYELCEKVYRAIIYYITGLVLTTYREASVAELSFGIARDMVGLPQIQAETVTE